MLHFKTHKSIEIYIKLLICSIIYINSAFAIPITIPVLKKEHSRSTYINNKDYEQFINIYSNIGHQNTEQYYLNKQSLKNPNTKKLYKYLYSINSGKNISLFRLDNFLNEFQNWPNIKQIQTKAELNFPFQKRKDVYNFFKKHKPITNKGWYLFGKISHIYNDKVTASSAMKKYFSRANFNQQDLKLFLRQYNVYLKKNDHEQKTINLLRKHKYKQAHILSTFLSVKHRQKLNIMIAISKGSTAHINNFLSKVAKKKHLDRFDVFTYYMIAKYLGKKKDTYTDNKILNIIKIINYKTTSKQIFFNNFEKEWFKIIRLAYLRSIKDKNYTLAYQLTSQLHFNSKLHHSEMLFFSGWTALRFLHDPLNAYKHFKEFEQIVSTPISKSRGYYWLGRTIQKKANLDTHNAEYYFQKAANYSFTFYGQLASYFLKKPLSLNLTKYQVKYNLQKKNILYDPQIIAFDTLYRMGKITLARNFGYAIINKIDDYEKAIWLAKFFKQRGFDFLSIRLMKKFQSQNRYIINFSYPQTHFTNRSLTYASKEFFHAISRQESEFNPQIISRSNAYGLMQLKKATAKYTAKKYGLKYNGELLLQDSRYNILIGSAHLNLLMNKFNNNLIMTIAGYNAGPNKVKKWVKDYGHPGIDVDPLDWIELIPYSETRNYVQRVLENKQIYQAIFNSNSTHKINLYRDLGYK